MPVQCLTATLFCALRYPVVASRGALVMKGARQAPSWPKRQERYVSRRSCGSAPNEDPTVETALWNQGEENPTGSLTTLSARMSELFGEKWQAIAEEAATSAELIGSGVTMLATADDYRRADYWQAFFALSGGFERSAKLAMVVDAFVHDKPVPTHKDLKDLGHGVLALVGQLNRIALELGHSSFSNLDPIQTSMLTILDNFAEKLDRYYNFNVLVEAKGADRRSPIGDWLNLVTVPVLAKHRAKDLEVNTHDTFFNEFGLPTWVRHARPWERMYLLQIARSIAELMDELGTRAMGKDSRVPYLRDFYAVYFNEDSYFRSRKKWTIYHR